MSEFSITVRSPSASDQAQDPAFGQEAVLDGQRAADAAVGADHALQQIQVLEEADLDLIQNPDGVLNPGDGDGSVVFQAPGFPPREGRADPDAAEEGLRKEMSQDRVILVPAGAPDRWVCRCPGWKWPRPGRISPSRPGS